MTLAQALSTFLALNLLIAVGFLALKLFVRGCSARSELKLHYRVLLFALLLASFHPLLPSRPFFQPVAKIWSAQSLSTLSGDFTTPDHPNSLGGYLDLSALRGMKAILQDQADRECCDPRS